jgi:hypothetical protein
MSPDPGRILWLALVLACAAPAVPAAHAADTAPAPDGTKPSLTAEQAVALRALDAALDRFAALARQDDDPPHRAATEEVLRTLQERRTAIVATYDQARLDELRSDVNLEYQRLASWMAPPRIPPPGARTGGGAERNVYQLNPDPSDRDGVKAALETLDREIKRCGDRVETLPAGPARESGLIRLKEIRERRAGLAQGFARDAWDAAIRDLKLLDEKPAP